MLQGRIVIIEPTGVRRSMPLTSRGLTIGRDSNNDIVVAYPFISRNHARITFDGQNYHVTDLDSANGTYLGHARLIPNTPKMWYGNTPLHVGDVLLQIETPGGATGDTGELQKRQRQKTEVVNWSPQASPTVPPGQTQMSPWLIAGIVGGIVFLLCLIAGVGIGIYYIF
jgi:pSer/pThr/pTyr-binding forkhead associated (FHA) protein